jgi:hypothetical protein
MKFCEKIVRTKNRQKIFAELSKKRFGLRLIKVELLSKLFAFIIKSHNNNIENVDLRNVKFLYENSRFSLLKNC